MSVCRTDTTRDSLITVMSCNRRVELQLDTQGSLQAKVCWLGRETIVPEQDIHGVLPIYKQSIDRLRKFFEHAYLIVSPCKKGGEETCIVRVFSKGLGGGNTPSYERLMDKGQKRAAEGQYHKAHQAYAEAEKQAQKAKNFGGQLAAQKAAAATDKPGAAEKIIATSLQAADIAIGNNQWESALCYLKETELHGGDGNEINLRKIRIFNKRAAIAKNQGNQKDECEHLCQAAGLGDDTARIRAIPLALALSEQRDHFERSYWLHKAASLGSRDAEDRLERMHLEHVRATERAVEDAERARVDGNRSAIAIPWERHYQLGSSIDLPGTLKAAGILKTLNLSTARAHTGMQTFHYSVFTREDKQSFMELLAGITIRGWGLSAEYERQLQITHRKLYCIKLITCSKKGQVFESATLRADVKQHLKANRFSAFESRYGTHFIGGHTACAVFASYVAINVSNRLEARKIGVMFNLSYKQVGFNFSGKHEYTDDIHEKIADVQHQIWGLEIDQPPPSYSDSDKLDELNRYEQAFCNAISSEKVCLEPDQAYCYPWLSIEDVGLIRNRSSLRKGWDHLMG